MPRLLSLLLLAACLAPAAAQPALLYDGADGVEAAQRLAAFLQRQDSVRVGGVVEGVVTADRLYAGRPPLRLLLRPRVTASDSSDRLVAYTEIEAAADVPDVRGAQEALLRRAGRRAACATRALTAERREAVGRGEVIANPLGGLAYRRVLPFRDTLQWGALERLFDELPGRVAAARRALAGCATSADPMAPTAPEAAVDRGRFRVVLFADTTLDLAPAVQRLRRTGYREPVVRDAPTSPASIKFGSAPPAVVSEVLAAVADALGLSTLDFQRQPAFAADDDDVFVNLPPEVLRRTRRPAPSDTSAAAGVR